MSTAVDPSSLGTSSSSNNGAHNDIDESSTSKKDIFSRLFRLGQRNPVLVVLAGIFVIAFMWQGKIAIIATEIEQGDQVKDVETKKDVALTMDVVAPVEKSPSNEELGKSLLVTKKRWDERQYEDLKPEGLQNLLKKIEKAKTDLHQLLVADYGNYTDTIFDSSKINNHFSSSEESMAILKRRMKLRVLEAQMTGEESQFVWVTAGNSVAAGHGNLFNQSYTYSIETAARLGFEAVGVNFTGKNYAMGTYSSGPELALCQTEIYGSHIDILSWDFGLTDGRKMSRFYSFWVNKAALHPSKPILFNWDSDRAKMHSKLVGLGTFFVQAVSPTAFPDSSVHPNPVSLPRGVAYYNCNGKAEANTPCGSHKFDVRPCTEAKWRVKWHPGWKVAHLRGRLVAFYLVQILHDVIVDMNNSNEIYTRQHVEALLQQDQNDLSRFLQSDLPNDWPELPSSLLYRSRGFCTSALLPNEGRFLGLVTQGKRGIHVGGGNHTGFDIQSEDTEPHPNDPNTPPPLWFSGGRQKCNLLNIDFKDFFSVRDVDGWMTGKYPNDMELQYYGYNTTKRQGMVVLCTAVCEGFAKCPKGYVKVEDINNGKLMVEVDGKAVTKVQKFITNTIINYCGLIEDVGPGNENGQYTIRFKVNSTQAAQLRLSSVIVF